MDIFLVIGLIGGLIIVVAAMLEKGASLQVLMSAEAMLVIIGGTVIALLNSFPKESLLSFLRFLVFFLVLRGKKIQLKL